MTTELLPEYTGIIYQGCLHCGGTTRLAGLESWVSWPYDSYTVVTRDGVPLTLDHHERDDNEDYLMLAHFEQLAVDDPDHDWRFSLVAGLRDATWQRHAPGTWVLIASGMGYA